MRKQAIYGLRAAHALARAHGHEWGVTIEPPDLDLVGRICVTWTIDTRWGVIIGVYRPAGRVIGVRIPILDNGTYGRVRVAIHGDCAIYQRHIDALRVCLDALGVTAELPTALPDPVPEGV